MGLLKITPSTNSPKNLKAKKCVGKHIHPESVFRSSVLGKQSPEILVFDSDIYMPPRDTAVSDV